MDVLLNLSKVDLYGWEQYKSDKAVESIIFGIVSGDIFPPVEVLMHNPHTYQLARKNITNNRLDGGHHRALGHLYAGVPLAARIIDHTAVIVEPVRIQDITLLEDKLIDENGWYVGPYGLIPVTSLNQLQSRDPNYRLITHNL